MAESVVFEVTEDRHVRKKRKRPGKSRVPFFLVCIPPFLIINYIIFRLATVQPDFTLTIGDAENYRKVPVEVSLAGRLPMELSVMYDEAPLELPETGNKVYSGFVEKNGTLEVRVRLFNGMEKTQYERISSIDEEPPSIIGEELDRTLLTVSFADDLSGVDFGTVYALDAEGNRVAPTEVSDQEGIVTFQALTDSLEVHATDRNGNEGAVLFDGLKLMGNTGDDRTGSFNTYGEESSSKSSSSGSSSSGSSGSSSSGAKKTQETKKSTEAASETKKSSESASSGTKKSSENAASETKKSSESASSETKKSSESASSETKKSSESASETKKSSENASSGSTEFAANKPAESASSGGNTPGSSQSASGTPGAVTPSSTASAVPAGETASSGSSGSGGSSPSSDTSPGSSSQSPSPQGSDTSGSAGPETQNAGSSSPAAPAPGSSATEAASSGPTSGGTSETVEALPQ